MNLGFSEIIERIDSELMPEYVPGAIKWVDDNFNGAWAAAVERFERALVEAIEKLNYDHAKREGEIYKETVLGLIRKYQQYQALNEADLFLESLQWRTEKKAPVAV